MEIKNFLPNQRCSRNVIPDGAGEFDAAGGFGPAADVGGGWGEFADLGRGDIRSLLAGRGEAEFL